MTTFIAIKNNMEFIINKTRSGMTKALLITTVITSLFLTSCSVVERVIFNALIDEMTETRRLKI